MPASDSPNANPDPLQISTMITTENTELIINHDDDTAWIKTRIDKRADAYVSEWLPRILSENLSHGLEKLLTKEFSWMGAEQKAHARRAVSEAPPERVEARLRQIVDQRVIASANTHVPPTARISFQRTLRIPDDGRTYPLPPGMGELPVRKMEPHAEKLPAAWRTLGGVLVPTYQSEAMWLHFSSRWPTALKIGTGTVNAISGASWSHGLPSNPQGYVVLPEQPWLDGFCVGPGIVRQFIAARLGDGYSVEEQVSGTTRGGLQIEAFPLLPEPYFDKKIRDTLPRTAEELAKDYLSRTFRKPFDGGDISFSLSAMGLGGGGRIKQEIFKDQWEPADWDLSRPSRVWVHLVEATVWKALTGRAPFSKPIGAQEYAAAGLPWFEYYRDDMDAVEGSAILAQLQSVFALAQQREDPAIPIEPSPENLQVKPLGPDAPSNTVTEWNGY